MFCEEEGLENARSRRTSDVGLHGREYGGEEGEAGGSGCEDWDKIGWGFASSDSRGYRCDCTAWIYNHTATQLVHLADRVEKRTHRQISECLHVRVARRHAGTRRRGGDGIK